MGHACCVLTFEPSDTKEKIRSECDDWANANVDHGEVGWGYCGLDRIKWTDLVFDNEKLAREYLNNTFGRYDETAVRFRKYVDLKPTKRYETLKERVPAARARLRELEETPHYMGVTVKTIKCKKCGSSLSTAYCGTKMGMYRNHCPVCREDLRPASKLERIAKARESLNEIEKSLREERDAMEKKARNKSVLCWAVACEVHC